MKNPPEIKVPSERQDRGTAFVESLVTIRRSYIGGEKGTPKFFEGIESDTRPPTLEETAKNS
ncbi:hypothetical protein N24_2267 [Corynebacterium suranareeae]|uniref:Uncharacterized protein n=1 Tax=Corynebacterium suranareeae TaxID=2506452 RepID=A0A160PR48_9CORY|nr:hypothetical protein N24_2267 [Corynebacterium suranareeae]